MIGHQDDRRVLSGKCQHGAQHHVVELIGHVNDILVVFKFLFRHPAQSRRMIAHVAMTEMVDSIKINAHEIPRLVLHDGGCHGLHCRRFRQNLDQTR